MTTKQYNQQSHTFIVNGSAISFYCSTTNTRNGFCHHIYTWGLGSEGTHTRVSYINRTWERFDYETAIFKAIEKLPKKYREYLRLEVDSIARSEQEKAARFLASFEQNFLSLLDEQKTFVREHTPEIETATQANTVAGVVGLMAAIR